jgi:hypothetical protein
MVGYLIGLTIVAALFGGLGAYVATQKRRPLEEGLILGALFGPLGCLIEALLPSPPQRPAARPSRGAAWEPRLYAEAVADACAGDLEDAAAIEYLYGRQGGERGPDAIAAALSRSPDENRRREQEAVREALGDVNRRGTVAWIAGRYREFLDVSAPGWPDLPPPKRRALLKDVEPRLMAELKLRPTEFGDLAAEARRLLDAPRTGRPD